MSEDVWLETPYGKVRDYLFGQLVLLSHYGFFIERIGTFPWLTLGRYGQQIVHVSRKSLDSIFEPARDMFEAVVKAVEGEKGFSYWYNEYNDENRSNFNTPLDKLLLNVAEKSETIRLPESFPQEWNFYRAHMTTKEIEEYNIIRSRLGLKLID